MRFHLEDLALFIRIAELGTLSAAAREKNVAVSHVTRSLSRLEADSGVQLLHRSTHGLRLTDEGDTFLAYGKRLLDTTDELQGEVTGKLDRPSGWVRVGVSGVMAQALIVPSLPGLYARHPDLHIDIATDDRLADMARDGIDIAIRTGSVQSETVVARQIGATSRSLYASPAYLARHGAPQTPDELQRHHLIANSRATGLNRWQRSDAPAMLEVQGDTRTDSSATLLSLVAGGVGISRLMDLVARPMVQAGQLRPVLQGHFDVEAIPVYAVMLRARHRLPKLRACVAYWQEMLVRESMLAGDGAA